MTAMAQERKETLLIAVIGAALLLVVLAIAYLVYQTLPAEDARAGSTALPEIRSAQPTTADPSMPQSSPSREKEDGS